EESMEIEALLMLPDKTLLAASLTQGLLSSHDDGRSWTSRSLSGNGALSLFATSGGSLLLGTIEQGLMRSDDGGANWQRVLIQEANSVVQLQQSIYIGTAGGIWVSQDDGQTWNELSPPPVSDFHTLLVSTKQLLVASRYSGIARATANGWEQ